jgi:hypothetical protein
MLAEDVRRVSPYSTRALRYYLAELRRCGWVETQTDFRMIYARPLAGAPVVERARRAPRPPRPFSGRENAQPLHGGRADFAQPSSLDVQRQERLTAPPVPCRVESGPAAAAVAAAVAVLRVIVPEPLAVLEVGRCRLSPERAREILAAYQEQGAKVRNACAWVRWACRNPEIKANAVASGLTAAAERSRSVRYVRAPAAAAAAPAPPGVAPAVAAPPDALAGLSPRERLDRMRRAAS